MPNENTSLEISANMLYYATDIAGCQLEDAEEDMRRRPDRYAEYTKARERMATTEADLISKLGDDRKALGAYSYANNAYATALAIEMYLRGVMDGGRIYHAFSTHELPKKGERHE